MQRKQFLKNMAILTLGLSGSSLGFANVKKWYDDHHKSLIVDELADISQALEDDFAELLQWLTDNGWAEYLREKLGVNLELRGKDLKKELIKELDKNRLADLRHATGSGYDDFSGERLIQPGFPAFSLLFHTIASPRVRPHGIKEYPSLEQIDLLENYIYALCNWEQLKSIYHISGHGELVFAVFAYEYRPAFKTPHHTYADMVYSRTGIGRLGNHPVNYDKINRSFTNKPADHAYEKEVAVTPARYGLYITRKVHVNDISLLREEIHKGEDSKDDRNDAHKTFLLPVRKLFKDDLLVRSAPLHFEEFHKSEKLEKFSKLKDIQMWQGRMPKPRFSKDLIVQDAEQRISGSSFLVISQAAPMIRSAREDGHALFFKVPPEKKLEYENRYFTALCTQQVENVELLDGKDPVARIFNTYRTPRNQPMFVNITNEQVDDSLYQPIPMDAHEAFEDKLYAGKYYAPLFEDSICDGRVRAAIDPFSLDKLKGINSDCLPAFSIVTAPDFFPEVDPLDFEDYDVPPGLSKESNFYEGGVASLATARIKPNPKVIDTHADDTRDTYLAVLSGALKNNAGTSQQQVAVYKNPVSDRGYNISGFLPDVASSVFAPGWDVTYCSLNDVHDIYIGTEGLGSPFIEDMKFCSALNGMWPATSPDAARTYQGSNESDYRNPTAVPLLDSEIGICADGPAGKAHECFGWDGEQGPFLEKIDGRWKINFTDLGRADAVNNALDGKLDMSKLRKLKSSELIPRMECLKMCINALPQKNFNTPLYKDKITGYTYLWLVSAEKVNWGKEDALALGIPDDLVGSNKNWITAKANSIVKEEGYLYLFVNSAADGNEVNEKKSELKGKKEWTSDFKRRRLDCHQVYVCQVTNKPSAHPRIAWGEVKNGKIEWNKK